MKNETRKKLKNSLELVCLRQYVMVSAVIFALGAAAAVLFSGQPAEAQFWGIAALVFLLCWLPVVAFWLWRSITIHRKAESYAFYRTKLTQPHGSRIIRAMYFTVLLEKPDGEKFVVNTHAIFFTHGTPSIAQYINKTVTIAHNEETGMTVVIG